MTKKNKSLGDRLREARQYLGLSQEEAANDLGISRSAISLIESNKRSVKADELVKFSNLYQRSMEYFTDGAVTKIDEDKMTILARDFQHLPESDQEELVQFAQYLADKAKIKIK